MRIQARMLLGMFGLALAVPMAATAAPFGDADGVYPVAAGQPQPQSVPHRHRSLFARRHCVECQRAYVKAHDGVDVPAPPQIQPGTVMSGPVLAAQVSTGPAGSCATCQGSAGMPGSPVQVADAGAPGYAVVGGMPGAMASADAPGYAVVGEMAAPGQDPTPIGVSRSGMGPGDPRMAAMGSRPGGAGSFDPSVVPTTGMPPAQVALAGPGSHRPHIIGHLFGVPQFGRFRREAQDRERQKHAAISYDQPNAKVSELPASMVYGKGGH